MNKKKNTIIPPLELNDNYITNVNEKATLFNDYFAEQCTPLNNSVELPIVPARTNSKICNFYVNPLMIQNLIMKLNPKKACGPDEISAQMLQLCPCTISVILHLLYTKILNTGHFPTFWKIANVQPAHKKASRQSVKNYRPISLLPICSKIFEKIIFDQIYTFLNAHNLISDKQSGFRPGDINFLSITNEIYETFEELQNKGTFPMFGLPIVGVRQWRCT